MTTVYYYSAKDVSFDNIDEYMCKCNYKRVVAYENEACDNTFTDDVENYNYICLTSASSARRIMPKLKGYSLTAISIGPSCSKALDDMGISNYVEAKIPSYEGIVERLVKCHYN